MDPGTFPAVSQACKLDPGTLSTVSQAYTRDANTLSYNARSRYLTTRCFKTPLRAMWNSSLAADIPVTEIYKSKLQDYSQYWNSFLLYSHDPGPEIPQEQQSWRCF